MSAAGDSCLLAALDATWTLTQHDSQVAMRMLPLHFLLPHSLLLLLLPLLLLLLPPRW